MIRARILVLLLPLFALPPGMHAQSGVANNEFAAWADFSFTNGHAFGFAQDRSLFLAEFRYGRRFADIDGVSFRYVAAVRPVAVLGDLVATPAGPRRTHIYGGGISPIGMQVTFLTHRRVEPFLSSNGGILYFTRRILSPNATQFNFTVEIAAGVELFPARRRSVTLGYKYHHISNANIAAENPAVDAHMIFAGFSFYR